VNTHFARMIHVYSIRKQITQVWYVSGATTMRDPKFKHVINMIDCWLTSKWAVLQIY